MNYLVTACSLEIANEKSCTTSPTCKDWGCRFLETSIAKIPTTEQEKAKLFVQVYREAKRKGVLECPHYRSSIIDEVLESFSS